MKKIDREPCWRGIDNLVMVLAEKDQILKGVPCFVRLP
jgi:hypothetical protein